MAFHAEEELIASRFTIDHGRRRLWPLLVRGIVYRITCCSLSRTNWISSFPSHPPGRYSLIAGIQIPRAILDSVLKLRWFGSLSL
jgi:hypothetical protein